MYTLPTFALLFAALIGSQTEQKIVAPVPRETPAPAIEGNYTLLSVVNGAEQGFGGGGAGANGFPGGVRGARGVGAGGGMVVTMGSISLLSGPTTITKNEITFGGNSRSGLTIMGYTIDGSKTPAAIDVTITNLRGKKSKLPGVVEVVGDRLIIALAKEGDERPKTTEEAEGVTVYYFQKSPPPPHSEFRIIAMQVGDEKETEKELNKLSQEGFELVSTTQPSVTDGKSKAPMIYFVLTRTVK